MKFIHHQFMKFIGFSAPYSSIPNMFQHQSGIQGKIREAFATSLAMSLGGEQKNLVISFCSGLSQARSRFFRCCDSLRATRVSVDNHGGDGQTYRELVWWQSGAERSPYFANQGWHSPVTLHEVDSEGFMHLEFPSGWPDPIIHRWEPFPSVQQIKSS